MESSPPSIPTPARPASARRGVLVKLGVIGALILVLQIPLLLIRDTLGERRGFRDQAVASIGATWGGPQTLCGPILMVPYTVMTRVQRDTLVGDRMVRSEEVREVAGTAWFLPSRLGVEGGVETAWRSRGIFRVPVFTAQLRIEGAFAPDVSALGLEGARMQWSGARVVVGVSDARGLRTAPTWTVSGSTKPFVPGVHRAGWPALIEIPVTLEAAQAEVADFAIDLTLQGAQRLAIAPLAGATTIGLRGSWPDPSFDGPALPVSRELSDAGFVARWESSYFGRGFPQQWAEHSGREGVNAGALGNTAVGVSLIAPVDAYRLVERALKYALLFLVLVFAVFFLLEVTSTRRVHPLQYLMVGAALTLFYLGFLALGEFVAVGLAYSVSAAASTLLITGYARGMLCGWARAVALGLGLGATYGYLFFILQLQDFALVAGTGALFVLLAVAMWVTRRMDWDDVDRATVKLEPSSGP